jgi:hypothetical protein
MLELVPFRRQGRRDALLKKATSLRANIAGGGHCSLMSLSAGESQFKTDYLLWNACFSTAAPASLSLVVCLITLYTMV